jgi:hypothetical protein
MPSSYSISARYTLQATGENNNTWGVILNQGVFQLVDDNINGRLAFTLSGAKTLTTINGATDEARYAMLDVTGGSGGVITIPPVPKGYFIRNNASGPLTISQGGAVNGIFEFGDMGPVFSDGAGAVFQLYLSNKTLRQFITDADQVVIDYVNAAITAGNQLLPPAAGQSGRALMVRGAVGSEVWTPSTIQQADVAGLVAALATFTANDAALAPAVGLNAVLSRAFYGDMF